MAKKVKGEAELEEEVLYDQVEEEESSLLQKIENFFIERTNLALGIGGGILLVFLAIFGYRFYQNSQSTTAQEEMFAAVYAFEEDSLDRAINGYGSNFGLLDIEGDYAGTPAANQARYYLGVAAFKQGDIAGAIDYLEGVSDGDNVLSMAKYAALGFAYQEDNDFEASAKAFEKAARHPAENKELSARWLFEAGKAFELAGDLEEALSAYTEIKSDYPKSTEAQSIDKYIGRVSR